VKRGSLWGRLTTASARALDSGALQPIRTRRRALDTDGACFIVRSPSGRGRKTRATGGRGANPFLPYEPEMFVAEVSATHVALLNKFSVIDHHLLIVTREFENQDQPLTASDFEALWLCMAEFDGLAFYNGGRQAGASQPHKHLQMIPLPMTPGESRFPTEPFLAHATGAAGEMTSPDLPFRHAIASVDPSWIDRPESAGEATRRVYRAVRDRLGITSGPYNLLVTREWLVVVPRSRERFGSMSINALGFAGSFFVRNDDEFEQLRESGPLTALAHDGLPR